jgi:hypothetical protein
MNESGEFMWKVVLGVASVLVVPLAAVSGVGVAKVVAGGNVSDVGVPMHAHGQMAVVAGAVLYAVIAAALLAILSRAAGEHRRTVHAVGLPLALGGLVLLTALLRFAYG